MTRLKRFQVLAIPETACLGLLTITGVLEGVVTTSDLNNSVRGTGSQCSVELSCVLVAAILVGSNDMEGVLCTLRKRKSRGEKQTVLR